MDLKELASPLSGPAGFAVFARTGNLSTVLSSKQVEVGLIRPQGLKDVSACRVMTRKAPEASDIM
jgi:hypothetical protein